MSIVNICLLLAAFAGLTLGGYSIYWARGEDKHHHTQWGRRLFTFTILGLGTLGLVAALARADALAPLGLLGCFLVVALLWETREPSVEVGQSYWSAD